MPKFPWFSFSGWGNILLQGLTAAKCFTAVKLPGVLIACVTVTVFLLGVRYLGGLESWELTVFDRLLQLQPDPGPDPRLLIVGITEADIKAIKRWPISDGMLAQALDKLQAAKPKVIGIDLFRNIPYEPGHQELVKQFQTPNIISILYIGNNEAERISEFPGLPKKRIGFIDLMLDNDNTVRRNIMFINNKTHNTNYISFSLRLSLFYLADKQILPKLNDKQEYQLGETVFSKLKSNSGGYQTANTGGSYQILLNYRSRNIAQQVTLTEVLNNSISPDKIKDKIVLIGAIAPSLKDYFFTPYSAMEKGNPQMPGVLIHAQMVSQIISAVEDNKPLFWFGDEWIEILWIISWGILGAIGVVKISRAGILVTFISLSLGSLFTIVYIIFMQAGWIPLVAPALAFIGTVSVSIIWQIQQERQQRETVMKLLGQQTSPEIAKTLWQERDRLLQAGILSGDKLTATILFTDIKNFSTISEQIDSEILMKWLNEYFQAMTEIIIVNQGIINKFIGDGIMAVFGVPIRRTNEAEIGVDAIRAVNCALAMGKRLEYLNSDWKNRGLPEIQIRAGIFTGSVTAGSLGGSERLEYGVIGDSVNIASRLESCEKDRQSDLCRILIAQETLIYLQNQFQVEYWGAIKLKGKQQAVEVYRVVGKN